MLQDGRFRQHPYIFHPLRLMMRVEMETEKIAVVLRDVVEDSRPSQRWRFDELRREGFSEPVLAALEDVTWREGEPMRSSFAVRCRSDRSPSEAISFPYSRVQPKRLNENTPPCSGAWQFRWQ